MDQAKHEPIYIQTSRQPDPSTDRPVSSSTDQRWTYEPSQSPYDISTMTWSKLVSIMTWNKRTQTKGERLRTQHDETSVFCCASVLVCGVFVKLRVSTSWSSLLCKLVYVPVTSLTNESYVSQDNGKIRWIRKAIYTLPRAVFKNKTNMKTL